MNRLKKIIAQITEKDDKAAKYVRGKIEFLEQHFDCVGEIGNMLELYAGMTGPKLAIPRKAMVLMAGDHGVAARGVSAYPQEVTVQMIYNYMCGGAGANVLARHAGADMFVVDIGVRVDLNNYPKLIKRKIAYGTNDFTEGPAMNKEQAIQALLVGIDIANECIDQGYGLFALAEMGIGNTTASAAIASVFTDLPPEKSVGRGTGIGDNRLRIKIDAVRDAIAINQPDETDGLDVLCKVGGYDIAGLAGVMIGGAARRVPTFVDGIIATAAALIAYKIAPRCRDYMLCSHLSAEPAHVKMLEVLGLTPILDMGMRLGEGTGAALGMTVLDVGIKLINALDENTVAKD